MRAELYCSYADYADSFQEQKSNTNKNLYDITSGGGNFVAVGAEGILLISSSVDDNAEVWERKETNTNAFLYAIHYENEQFLAAGDARTILSSDTNGRSWTNRQLSHKETKNSEWTGTNFYTVNYRLAK